jgi:hypothetical protein
MCQLRKSWRIRIYWSKEDQLFLVTIPEFSHVVIMPCTHGKTRQEAIDNGEEVIAMYLGLAEKVEKGKKKLTK